MQHPAVPWVRPNRRVTEAPTKTIGFETAESAHSKLQSGRAPKNKMCDIECGGEYITFGFCCAYASIIVSALNVKRLLVTAESSRKNKSAQGVWEPKERAAYVWCHADTRTNTCRFLCH